MEVVALPEVREYLMELINILYEKEYFGFEENAQKYVEELFFDVSCPRPLILTGTGKICYIPRSRRTRLHSGMCFSMSIKKTGKSLSLYAISATTMLQPNIFKRTNGGKNEIVRLSWQRKEKQKTDEKQKRSRNETVIQTVSIHNKPDNLKFYFRINV